MLRLKLIHVNGQDPPPPLNVIQAYSTFQLFFDCLVHHASQRWIYVRSFKIQGLHLLIQITINNIGIGARINNYVHVTEWALINNSCLVSNNR